MLGRLLVVAMTMAAAMFAAPVAAQGLSPTIYEGGSLPLSVPVTASVGGVCGFGAAVPQGSFDAGAIDTTAWTHDFNFEIDCNVASRVAVVSLNGGLKTPGTIADAGYVGLAPYTVELNLAGNTTSIVMSCDVANLEASVGTPCSFRGPASTTEGLRLAEPSQGQTSYLRVSAPAYGGPGNLVSGSYGDTLTVTIAAAP